MSNPTAAAMRAAAVVVTEYSDYRGAAVFHNVASIIDAETGLPELIAALKACVESSASRTGGPCLCGACNMARAAIAKSEGRA